MVRRVYHSTAIAVGIAGVSLLAGCATSPQVDSREAERLVQRLSWASVDGGSGWLTVRWDGPVAERLMQIGRPAGPALVSALEDPERAVAAHIILTSLFHRDRVGAKQRWIYREPRRYHTEADLLGVAVTVNGLAWTVHFDPTRYYIAPDDLRQNAQRWRREITKPSNQAMRRTASKAAIDVVEICHPRFGCVARFLGLAPKPFGADLTRPALVHQSDSRL